ncbi:MAG TPA: hypothetical protein ENK19_00380, partial [Acidobacteria bacterium]|nr:hypothetical protein [Acidobacteriota bacterium]
MYRSTRSAMLALLTLAAFPLGAQTVYVPAAAHVSGYGGTLWRTDVEIKACAGSAAQVELEALIRDRKNSDPPSRTVSVAEGHAVRLEDVLASTFGLTGAAAIRVTTVSGCALVTSRTYNDTADGTYGQYVPAVPELDAFSHGETAEVIQLGQSADNGSGYRSALGLLNVTGMDVSLDVELFSATGASLGSIDQVLEPFELVQLDRVFRRVTEQEIPDGYALISTGTVGGRFLAYASVVDNGSGDAIFIPALRAPEATAAAIVADHRAADAFSQISASGFDAARTAFPKIFYGHTSHGSQIMTGLQMLESQNPSLVPPQFTEVSDDLGHNGDLGWVDR